MTKINKKNFEAACKISGGVGAAVARALGVTRAAISIYLKKNPEMKHFLEDEGEKILDIAEHNINKEIMAGNVKASMWALLNRKEGKARGYGPSQAMEHINATPVEFRVIERSDKDIKGEKLKHK